MAKLSERPVWVIFFYHPLTWLSLGVHALLLLLPTVNLSPPETAEEPEPPEEEAVEVLSLADIVGAPAPPPEAAPPAPAPPAPAPPAPPQPVPQPIQPQVARPTAASPPAPAQTQTTQTTAPPTQPPPAFDTPAARSQLSGSFGNLSGALPIEVRPAALPNPQKPFFFQPDASGQVTNNSPRLDKIAGMQLLNDRRPDEIIPEALQAAANSQLTLNEVGDYGSGRLYQLVADDGTEAGFLNIVPGGGGISTLLVLWESDPR